MQYTAKAFLGKALPIILSCIAFLHSSTTTVQLQGIVRWPELPCMNDHVFEGILLSHVTAKCFVIGPVIHCAGVKRFLAL